MINNVQWVNIVSGIIIPIISIFLGYFTAMRVNKYNREKDLERRFQESIKKFRRTVIRKYSDVKHEGQAYIDLIEKAEEQKEFIDFVDYRDKFLCPVNEKINDNTKKEYIKIQEFYDEKIRASQNGERDFVYADEYLKLLQDLKLDKEIEDIIKSREP
ncbi:hypothetical protein QBE52_07380 [Clostridiaceae bacterium 35-E11]